MYVHVLSCMLVDKGRVYSVLWTPSHSGTQALCHFWPPSFFCDWYPRWAAGQVRLIDAGRREATAGRQGAPPPLPLLVNTCTHT